MRMGSSSRCLMLLTATSTHSSFLRQRLPSILRLVHFHLPHEYLSGPHMLTIPPSLIPLSFISFRTLHSSYYAISSSSLSTYSSPRPWPEWIDFVNFISSSVYSKSSPSENYEFSNVSEEFCSACFSLARHRFEHFWKLPKNEIQLLINNGPSFLFEDKEDSAQRMRAFLSSNAPFTEAIAVDLMKYLLSNASISNSNQNPHVESSVKSLLRAITQIGNTANEYQQPENLVNSKPEMKRGDWICRKCSFMNFARNEHCIECDEARPQRAAASGEWECPRCDFFNYGRNSVCLRCDCKRSNNEKTGSFPKKEFNSPSISETAPFREAGHVVTKRKDRSLSSPLYKRKVALDNGETMNEVPFVPFPPNYFAKKVENNSDIVKENEAKVLNEAQNGAIDLSEEAKAERWFKRVGQIKDIKELGEIPDEDFPTIMPIRKGVNRFVVTKRKTPFERKLTSSSQKNLNPPLNFDLYKSEE